MAKKTKNINRQSGQHHDSSVETHSMPMSPTPTAGSHRHPPTAEGRRPSSPLSLLGHIGTRRALQLVLLAALYAHVSQLSLTPVYGAIPSALYHRYGLTASFLLAFALRGHLPVWAAKLVTSFCFSIPAIQFVLFQRSSVLGNPWGPLITESLTCYPLTVMSISLAMEYFDEAGASGHSTYGDAVPSMGLFMLFTILQQSCRSFIASRLGPGFLRSRIGMQLIAASLYAMVLPESLLWPSAPAVAFTMLANPHCGLSRTTEVLNNTLHLYDYSLLERKESLTGYISVLEDNQRGFRVMRCDHSLLGGEWKLDPPHAGQRRVGEPIYAIFTMLEAVRLIEPSPPMHSLQRTALVVGLGIGTAPSALIAHGVNTTILEIDPVVHEFAIKYFNLPQNHSYLIGDAVTAVRNSLPHMAESYDYIIHDVFTGGAEPVELFTVEFLTELHTLLKPDGVVAINYAGDLAMPAASLIYRTITSVFVSCRTFREDKAPVPGTKLEDFTNMVFFCRKKDIPLTFRRPTTADFLGSGARREFLLPQYEIPPELFHGRGVVLSSGKTSILEKWQAQSAVGHWKVMRTVLPDAIWESW